MSILSENFDARAIASEYFDLIVADMDVKDYKRIAKRHGLKKTPQLIRDRFWKKTDSITLVTQALNNHICEGDPITSVVEVAHQVIRAHIQGGHMIDIVFDSSNNTMSCYRMTAGEYLCMLRILFKEKT